MALARETPAAECARWVYCGAAYYLPVRGLIARAHALPAPPHDRLVRAHTHVSVDRRALASDVYEIHLNITGAEHFFLTFF